MKYPNQNLFRAVTLGFVTLALAAVYIASVAYRAWPYRHLDKTVVSRLHSPDPALGYSPAPNARGFLRLPAGERAIPTFHDGDGLRVPGGKGDEPRKSGHPRLLFLGDSFTYGDLTLAEDTFAYKTAAKLGGASINAGANGYGFAGMVLRARQLIPKYKPDYVVVQYSPWLVGRAMSEFGPTYYPVHSPVPYYAGESVPEIVAPPFAAAQVDLPPQAYGVVQGLWRLALPVLSRDDFHVAAFRLKQMLGMRQKPSSDAAAIIRSAYGEMASLAKAHGAEMVVLVLGHDARPLEVPFSLFPPGTYGVDARMALLRRLPEPTNEWYMRHYWHRDGNPAMPVDPHPNEWAHEVIAGVLADAIRQLEGGRWRE